MDRNRLAGADLVQLHAAPELARAQPHERDAIAVHRVHVGLHLEDKAGDSAIIGRNGRGIGRLRTRRRREAGQRIDQLGDAMFLERGAEIDRGEVAMPVRDLVERRIAGLDQRKLFLRFLGQ